MDSLKIDKSVAICALARDCADALTGNIARIEELRTSFRASEVIVIENDSQDNTKELLLDWQREGSRINILSKDNFYRSPEGKDKSDVIPGTSMDRISRMSIYRNEYLNWIKNNHNTFDYVLMIDIDVEDFSIKGILKSIKDAPSDWGGLFANGYTDSKVGGFKFYKIFHDIYAFLDKMPSSKPYLTFAQMFRNSKLINKKLKENAYVPVVSGFGGVGIYKFEAIMNLQYESVNNEDILMEAVCEHIPFNISVINRGYQNYICEKMKVYYGESNNLMVLRNLLPLPIFKFLAFMITFKKLKA